MGGIFLEPPPGAFVGLDKTPHIAVGDLQIIHLRALRIGDLQPDGKAFFQLPQLLLLFLVGPAQDPHGKSQPCRQQRHQQPYARAQQPPF